MAIQINAPFTPKRDEKEVRQKGMAKETMDSDKKLDVFVPSNGIILLNLLTQANKIYGAVRLTKIEFFGFKEFNLPLNYIFYQGPMGPTTLDLKHDYEYLSAINLIDLEYIPTDEANDLLVFSITDQGRDFVKKYNPHENLTDQFKRLIETYGYQPRKALVEKAHREYTELIYKQDFRKELQSLKTDMQLALMFWDKWGDIYTKAAPFWYLAQLLECVFDRLKNTSNIDLELINKLHELIIGKTKEYSIVLKNDETPEFDISFCNFLYDEGYALLNQGVEAKLIKREELE